MELNEPHTKYEHASLNLKVLLLVFAVLLIVVLGYFVWQQNHTSSDSADATITSPKTTTKTDTSTTATDPTADWKTYTSATNGYSVKYPATYSVSETGGVVSIKSSTYTSGYADLSITVKDTTQSLADYIATQKAANAISGEMATTLDGVSAYEAVDLGALSAYTVISVKDAKSYSLLMNAGNKDTLALLKAALTDDQKLILASFKFTN